MEEKQTNGGWKEYGKKAKRKRMVPVARGGILLGACLVDVKISTPNPALREGLAALLQDCGQQTTPDVSSGLASDEGVASPQDVPFSRHFVGWLSEAGMETASHLSPSWGHADGQEPLRGSGGPALQPSSPSAHICLLPLPLTAEDPYRGHVPQTSSQHLLLKNPVCSCLDLIMPPLDLHYCMKEGGRVDR